jgi:uncharacterized protein YegL
LNLLLPSLPFENDKVPAKEYVKKLLESEDQSQQMQNLILCSVMASNDEEVLKQILSYKKVEGILEVIKS